jgi:hypothetical protein
MENLLNVSRHQLRVIIGLTVASIWTIVTIGGLIIQDFTPLTVVTPVMLVVVGFLFGRKMNGD